MTQAEALQEMADGYRDGRDPDAPAPSANRSASYRHGFAVGRADCAQAPRDRDLAQRRRIAAAQAIDSDCAA